jgi:hypothetical protein
MGCTAAHRYLWRPLVSQSVNNKITVGRHIIQTRLAVQNGTYSLQC